jgi:glycosyltransferase involved in cell wall biosynthesis
MNTVPEISIITPVWNGLPYIKECIESVLSQEFQNWELLIGDNCSTDGTREYLSELDDPRIKVFKHDKNLGIWRNLNFLFSKASTPLAYFLCADDYFLPGGLGNVITEWKMVGSRVACIGFNSEDSLSYSKLMRYSHSVIPQRMDPPTSRLSFFLFGNFPGNLSNMSARVDAIREAGGFVEHLKSAGDFELWSRLGRNNDIVVTNTKSAYVRRHEGVASNYLNRNGEQYSQQIEIFEELINELSSQYDRKRLISYFNLGICSYHFRRAIKSALYGRFAYMKVMFSVKSVILWPKWKQLLTCFPLGFTEEGRESLSVRLAKDFVNESKQINAVVTKLTL